MPLDPLGDLRSYLVPVDGSAAGFHALAAICQVARRTKATIYGVYVIEVPRSLPLDADMDREIVQGERILERAEQIAEEHDCRVDGALLQARQAGHAVVDEAVERGVDAIVVGLDYHRPYGQFQLGRLPQYVLEHSPTQVWLMRYAPPKGEGERVAPGGSRS